MRQITKDLSIYNQIGKNTITTTEIIKSSFKNVFEKLKKQEYVVVENSRQHKKMVIVSLDDYVELLSKLETYEEQMFDDAAAEHVTKGKHKFKEISETDI